MRGFRAVWLLVAVFLAVVWMLSESSTRSGSEPGVAAMPVRPVESRDRVQALERRVEELARSVDHLERLLATARAEAGGGRAPLAGVAPEAVAAGPVGPEWYLAEYARSFKGGGQGSEFYRLAVEAYVPVLVRPIAVLILGPTAGPPALRVSLVRMLSDGRLIGSRVVEGHLLAVLERAEPDGLLLAALDSLAAIGDGRTAWALEAQVWRLAPPILQRALTVLVTLFGEEGNGAVARLLLGARDDGIQSFLLDLLEPAEIPGALDAFALARTSEVPVRLAAARRVGEFHDARVLAFVEDWLAVEFDERVRQALGAARRTLSTRPAHSPLQATGPPDADPHKDDPRAWASQVPDGGLEWLELDYPRPLRISRVTVHQVNVGGALAELIAIEPGGARHTIWKGTAPQAVGPFEIAVPTTPYRAARLRVVLDTRRAAGWNEIDAVELAGPDGAEWAGSARASSAFGQGGSRTALLPGPLR